MEFSWQRLRAVTIACSLAVGTVSLGGCGGGVEGVELNGKLFDALGVSGNGFGKKVEPKTQARAPLVLPPDPNRLPEPGSAGGIQTGALQDNPAWPKDREALRASDEDAKKRAQDKFCKEDGNWRERATKNETAAEAGPAGRCQGSVFSVLTDSITGNKE